MFSYKTKVSYSKIDRNGKVPLHEIMNYLQDCSTFHSESLGVGVEYMNSIGKAWVLIAYKIKINKQLKIGQNIIVSTAPTKFRGLLASRQFCIQDDKGEMLILADSEWVLIDKSSRKAVRITEEDKEKYPEEQGFGAEPAIRKIKFNTEGIEEKAFPVLKTYIDSNGHMNNADYLRAAEEFIPDDFDCNELDIVYSRETLYGETITPYIYKEDGYIGINFVGTEGEQLTKIKLIRKK